jgi:secreted Zn-dependent insulinase-like peptidase
MGMVNDIKLKVQGVKLRVFKISNDFLKMYASLRDQSEVLKKNKNKKIKRIKSQPSQKL